MLNRRKTNSGGSTVSAALGGASSSNADGGVSKYVPGGGGDATVTVDKPQQQRTSTSTSAGNSASSSAANSGNKTSGSTGGVFRLGGLSRYLMEKAQSNDSGLDLSPGTLQTLVHPIRISNSSSSISNRNLFESSECSDDSFPKYNINCNQNTSGSEREHTGDTGKGSFALSTPLHGQASENPLSETSEQSTVIERTLEAGGDTSTIARQRAANSTDNSIQNIKREPLEQVGLGEHKTLGSLSINTSNSNLSKYQSQPHQSMNSNKSSREPLVAYHLPHPPPPQDKTRVGRFSNNSGGSTKENTDPSLFHSHSANSNTYHQNSQQTYLINNNNNSSNNINNSFPSGTEVAATIASGSTRVVHQTPKPKSCKKPPMASASLRKKSSGGGGGSGGGSNGWKFLSEHVQGKEFLILDQLGKGGCGEVSLVMEKESRKQHALKVVRLHGLEEAFVEECINEVEMLIDLKGTDLVVDIQAWEFSRTNKTMKIVMERGQCDLHHTISKSIRRNKPIKLLKLKFIWESLLVIVDKIHSTGIVHADLKPANFIWVDDNLKIIDFGIASRLQSDLTSIAMPNPKGTLNYVSPEIIRQDTSGRSKLSPKSDIWALGCILYLMIYGKTPFEQITHPVTKMNAIIHANITYPPLPPHLHGSHVFDVLQLCFQTDYKLRPSAAELLQHPFLHA